MEEFVVDFMDRLSRLIAWRGAASGKATQREKQSLSLSPPGLSEAQARQLAQFARGISEILGARTGAAIGSMLCETPLLDRPRLNGDGLEFCVRPGKTSTEVAHYFERYHDPPRMIVLAEEVEALRHIAEQARRIRRSSEGGYVEVRHVLQAIDAMDRAKHTDTGHNPPA